jgi:chemotaxis protein methyltransferase CheR
MTVMSADTNDEAELDLLLEGICERYHYDFRHYSRAHLHRRIARAQVLAGSPSVADLLDSVLQSPTAFTELLRCMTIPTSDLFRDPDYYAVLRREVIPRLATYPWLRIWVAGCGTGEEAYSLAIVLAEEGLLERSLIYATDIDAESLRVGQAGAYDLERVRGFTENYFRADGRASLADYYTAAHSRVAFSPHLRKHVLFSDHSLATDSAFAEVQLVSCRNVLIYFDRALQDRAVGLFQEALCPRGFLGLGAKETLAFSSRTAAFEPFAVQERVYRMR